MSDIRASAALDIIAPASTARAAAILRRASQSISVEIAGAARLAGVRAAWIDLVPRSDAPNVFMDPALVQAAASIGAAGPCRAVLAWRHSGGRKQLAGIWSFTIGRPRTSALPMRVLNIPPCTHGYLSTPVIDRDGVEETLDAMLDRIAADPALPKIVALDTMATDGPVYRALVRVLAERGTAPCVFSQTQRPKLVPGLEGTAYLEKALSSSTRKKLRQHRRRLSEKGALTSSVASEPQAVRAALEQFLTIEAAGWKGRQGTALLSSERDAAFMRAAVGALADAGCASIHSLALDGRPISTQIVARAGAAAFTWKTAYDEAFQEFSPGMLLLEDYTAAFLADTSIACVDSCSFDDSGFMSAWTDRQPVADLWIDARRGGSLEFRALGGLQKSYRDVRAAAKAAYLKWQKSRKK